MNDGQEFKPPPMREDTLVLFPYSPSMLRHIPKYTHEAYRMARGHRPIGSRVLSASVSTSRDAILQKERMPTRAAGPTGLQVVPHTMFNQWRKHLCTAFRKVVRPSSPMPGFLDSVSDEQTEAGAPSAGSLSRMLIKGELHHLGKRFVLLRKEWGEDSSTG